MLNINNQETGSSTHSMVKDVSNISYRKINFISIFVYFNMFTRVLYKWKKIVVKYKLMKYNLISHM